MAIFNEEYTSAAQEAYDFYTSDDNQSVNEAVGADDIIMATIIASAVSIVVGSISLWVANRATIKAALAKYPKIHEDCKPLKSFTKKIHNISPYKDEPGKEMGPVKRTLANSWLFKNMFDKCVCYMNEDGKIAMFYCYRHSTKHSVSISGTWTRSTSKKIAMCIKDDSLKKHEKFYFSSFLNECKMTNKDTIRWARDVLKGE